MRYVFVPVAMVLLLAGCDQNSKSNDIAIKGRNGSVTISANGQNFTMKASDDKNGSFTMTGNGEHFTMHAGDGKQTVDINATGGSSDVNMPNFLSAYPGGKVQSTTIDASGKRASGMFTFATPDSPDAVISYYKKKSASAGFTEAMNMSSGASTTFTAQAGGGKKTFQVTATSSGSGSHVQVVWSGGN